jgi:hypothetical protein
MTHFGRDYLAEWHDHLERLLDRLAAQSDKLVVEGYLLCDCRDHLSAALARSARVFQVAVRQRAYYYQNRSRSIEDIAALAKP